VKIGPKTCDLTFTTVLNPVPYGTFLVQIRRRQFPSVFRTEHAPGRLTIEDNAAIEGWAVRQADLSELS
jgi:hypothetical protein